MIALTRTWRLGMAVAIMLFTSQLVQATNTTVPAGTTFLVRTGQTLSSSDLSAGHRFTARLEADLVADNGTVVAPRGSTVYGVITEARRSGRLAGVHRVRQGFPFVFQELEVDGKDGAIVNTTPSDKAFNGKAFAIDCLLALVTATTVTWLWKTQPERRRWGIFSWLFNKKEMRELDILLNDGSCRTLR